MAKVQFKREILASLTTFSTMAYIIVINPQILSLTGMDFGAVMTATILSSVIATLYMGIAAGYPFALAPGMGLNAYFTYSVVLQQGNSWQSALGACFIAGVLFLLLSLIGWREKIMHAIPPSLRCASTAGIGLFLAFIGLKNVEIIIPHEETFVGLGNMRAFEVLLTGLGIVLITTLLKLRVPGAFLIGIAINWGIGLLFGFTQWKGIAAFPPDITPTLLQLDIKAALSPPFIPIMLSFLFIGIFDGAGTLMGLGAQGKFLTPEGKLPRAKQALIADAVGTISASLLGSSTLTTFLESSSGIAAGGRTGITAIGVAACFFLALFFSPLAASIPLFATAPVLVIIGALMMKPVLSIDWEDLSEAIPAFLILATIPLTFSIASGIALGFVVYPLIKLFSGRSRELNPMIWIIAALFMLKFVLV